MRKVAEADSDSRAGETDEQTYSRAMKDPEVQRIMSDPIMVSILQQAQNDPPSMMQHMQNPDIRKKVEVLIRAVSDREMGDKQGDKDYVFADDCVPLNLVRFGRVLSRRVVNEVIR